MVALLLQELESVREQELVVVQELELAQRQVRELESDLVLAKARLQVAVSVQQREKE
jgi:hypothetical protein